MSLQSISEYRAQYAPAVAVARATDPFAAGCIVCTALKHVGASHDHDQDLIDGLVVAGDVDEADFFDEVDGFESVTQTVTRLVPELAWMQAFDDALLRGFRLAAVRLADGEHQDRQVTV